MRRVPPAVWIFAPLAIGLLYAAGHALLAPRPTLDTVVPEDAILTQRFRSLAAFDRCSFGPRRPGQVAPRELLGRARNVPGLPGVDHDGPLHMILMPRTLLRDSTLAVFALADPYAFERAFDRPDLIESGATRHAQHLVIRGAWGAVAPDREAARRIGTGGLTAEARGEDHALAADVPRLVDHALGLAHTYPWRSILLALGVDLAAATQRRDRETGALVMHLPRLERVVRIRDTWTTARMWAWLDERRLRVELVPSPGDLAEVLRAPTYLRGAPAGTPAPPAAAEVWLVTPPGRALEVLAEILRGCGVVLPADLPPFFRVVEENEEATGPGPEGRVLGWGVSTPDAPETLTYGVVAPAGELPALALLLPEPDDEVRRRSGVAGRDVLTVGPGARRAMVDMETHLARGEVYAPPADGRPTLAHFGLRAERAARLLGRALEPGGFLHCLQGGDVEGRLTVGANGTLVLEAWVAR